jgi:Arc/MetJ-type ribon-helix-helix transcriptional regulator
MAEVAGSNNSLRQKRNNQYNRVLTTVRVSGQAHLFLYTVTVFFLSLNRFVLSEILKYYIVLLCRTMEVVSVKFQEHILKELDHTISKHNFNSRTEFIREAVRDKMSELNKEELIKEFFAYQGKAHKYTTSKQNTVVKEQVSKELLKELEERFR